MADEYKKIDANFKGVAGITDDGDQFITLFRFDPTTKRLKVTATTLEVSPATILPGRTNVTTAGTRVVLSALTSIVSVTIERTVPNAFLLSWSEYVFDHGYGDHGTEEEPIVFDDLTQQEKADLIEDRITALAKAEAHTHDTTEAMEAERISADDARYNTTG